MKIAVSATFPDLNSPVEPQFAQTSWFVVVDSDTGKAMMFGNAEAHDGESDPDIATTRLIANAGVRAVITGEVSLKAADVLRSIRIPAFQATECTVAQALDRLRHGQLDSLVRPGA